MKQFTKSSKSFKMSLIIICATLAVALSSCNKTADIQALNNGPSSGGTKVTAPTYLTITQVNPILFRNSPDTLRVTSDGAFISAPTAAEQIPGTNMYVIRKATDGMSLSFSSYNKGGADGTTSSTEFKNGTVLNTEGVDQSYLSWDSTRQKLSLWRMSSYTITVVGTGVTTNGNLDPNTYSFPTLNLMQTTISGVVGTNGYQFMNPGTNNRQINYGYSYNPPNVWSVLDLNDVTYKISKTTLDADGFTRTRVQIFTKVLQ